VTIAGAGASVVGTSECQFMQGINSVPSAAIPTQRVFDPAQLNQQQFESTDDAAGREQLQADVNGDASGDGADSAGLQRAEVSVQTRVTPTAPEGEQAALGDSSQNAPQSDDPLLQRARDIINQFDVSNFTSEDLIALRETLEPLGVGRNGRNLVDLSV
jgi:hypothetical protein